ncbi:MAG: acetylglutamate kinase [Dehalococcoidia bacterium]
MSITVIKIGGSTLGRHDTSLDDIAALHAEGRRFVIVHGGGATIGEWQARQGVEPRFHRGLRATDAPTLEIVVAVLAGLVNKRLVSELQARSARALGLSGADAAILRARRYDPELGYVGEVAGVDAAALRSIAEGGAIVVFAPIAVEVEGEVVKAQLLNVNADTAAGEIAAALPAEQLVFLTDVAGVLDESGGLRERLSADEARDLLQGDSVSGGMIPKLEAALRANEAGVPTVIADGREKGALRSILSAGASIGTRIG